METLIEYFVGQLQRMADNPGLGSDPFVIAGFIAAPDDSTESKRALALAIEAWAIAYAADARA